MSQSHTVQGLWIPEKPKPVFDVNRFAKGTIDVSTEVDRGIELIRMAGGFNGGGDEAKLRNDFTTDLVALEQTGLAMRIVPDVPGTNLPFNSLIALMDGVRPEGVEEASIYDKLWVPGVEADSLTPELLAGPAKRVALRGLLLSVSSGDYDPVLHHRGLPADDHAKEMYDPSAKTTQTSALTQDISAFEATFPELDLRGASYRDYAFLVTAFRRNLRQEPGALPLSRGYMRDLGVGRHNVGGGSVVAGVDSDGGWARFDGGSGHANDLAGVGLSAGRKDS